MKKSALLLMLTLGCGDDANTITLPQPLSGNLFELRAIDGVTLPAAFYAGSDLLVVADTLALHDDGTGERRSIVPGDTPWGTVAQETAFHWMQSGSLYTITFDCPPAALCTQGPQLAGRWLNDTLTITQSTTNRVPLVYRFIFHQAPD